MTEIIKNVKKPKPFFNPNPHAYSPQMKGYNHWLYCQLVERADGTWSKPPCNSGGYYTDATDEKNWHSFEKAFEICKANPDKLFGLGFSISPACPIKAIDFDHIYDPETGKWNQQARQELGIINTRIEWSPSHTGVHAFLTCPIMLESKNQTQPDGTKREMYFDKHYVTVTGEVVEGFPTTINEVDTELVMQLYNKWFPEKAEKTVKREASVKFDITSFDIPESFVDDPDNPFKGLSPTKDQVMGYCRNAPNGFGEKFDRLFNGNISEYESDESDADMAIAGLIAHNTPNYSIIKEIIQESALWDAKWEREDYCRGTINKAIANSRWGNANNIPTPIDRQLGSPIATQTLVPESPEVDNDNCQQVESTADITEFIIPKGYSVSGECLTMQKFDSKTENMYNETICYSPIYLTGASQDIDTNEISYEVSFTDSIGHQHKSIYMQSELITNKIKQTALANQINLIDTQLNNLNKYFNMCIRDSAMTLPFTIMANKYGWRNEDIFIVGNKMIGKDGVKLIRSMQDTEKYERKGSTQEWIRAIEPVIDDDTVRFKCYGVLAVPLLKLFNVQSFIVDHYGHSSKGKTFGLQVAMSLIGDPKNLLLPANSSLTYIEMQAAVCDDLALALDETSLQDPDVLTKIIYMISNEFGKGRGTNAKLQEINRWRTIAFTTGENTIINTKLNGAGVRAISFNIPMRVMDAGQVEKSRAIIERNYGHIIELYMARVFQNKGKLKKQFDEAQKEFIRDGQSTMLNRMGSYFAIIAVAGSILEDIFKEIGISQVDHIKLVRKFFFDLKEHEQEPYHVKALRFLNDFFNVHATKLFENNGMPPNRDVYGYISEGYIDAIPKVVKDALKEGQFNDTVIADLIKEGIIITNSGRPDFKITLKSNGSQPHVYRFDIEKMRQKLEN